MNLNIKSKLMTLELLPLITCTSVSCEEDLHCFKDKRANRKKKIDGHGCYACGKELIDWERIHQKNLKDHEATFEFLKLETIRYKFWNINFDPDALRIAEVKGIDKIYQFAEKRIAKDIGVAKPFREVGHTPYTKNVVYYAQHATATCCRLCIEYWHNIPRGKKLTEKEIEYLTGLINLYLDGRLVNSDNNKLNYQLNLF